MENNEEKKLIENLKSSRHKAFSRKDTLLNDLRNSTVQGILSYLLSLCALITLCLTIYGSFRMEGQGGILAGILPFFSLLLSVLSLIFGIAGFRNQKKIRHYMEKRGIIISVILIGCLIWLYVRGLRIFLNRI